MKTRLLNVVKWILITLGVIFLFQILLFAIIVAASKNFTKITVKSSSTKDRLEQIQPVIDYVEDYKNKNGKYPQTIQNVKINSNVYYDYSTFQDSDCYKIKTKTKNDNVVKEFQRCSQNSKNSKSHFESYSEYIEK